MLNKKKVIDTFAIIILFVGFSLAFLPHVAHIAVGLGDESSHLVHVISGMILVVIGISTLIISNKYIISS